MARWGRQPAALLAGALLRGAFGPRPAAAQVGCTSSEGTDYDGVDLLAIGAASSVDCCQRCAADQQCAVAVYDGTTCRLKGADSASGQAIQVQGSTALVPNGHTARTLQQSLQLPEPGAAAPVPPGGPSAGAAAPVPPGDPAPGLPGALPDPGEPAPQQPAAPAAPGQDAAGAPPVLPEQAAGAEGQPLAAGGGSGCDVACEHEGVSQTCRRRIHWAREKTFKGDADACIKSWKYVMDYCDVCHGCSVADAECSGQEVEGASPKAERLFDCQAGYAKWEKGWSDAKKVWCCEKYELGCAANFTLPFDCEAGFSNWEKHWKVDKKVWCCRNHHRGCVYDCKAGVQKWQRGWSQDKKTWCCENEEIACAHDCRDQFDSWQSSWTAEKKSWCCKYKRRGCVLTTAAPSTLPSTTGPPADVGVAAASSDAVASAGSDAVAPAGSESGSAVDLGGAGTPAGCTFEDGADYGGEDLADIEVDSKEDCCTACANQPGCTVSVLLDGRCFLKSAAESDRVAKEGCTACVVASENAAGSVQEPTGPGAPDGDPAPGDAAEPAAVEAPGDAPPTPAPPPATPPPPPAEEAPHHVDEEDLALYNCDDEGGAATWEPGQREFCCENEAKGCDATGGVQGASAALGSLGLASSSRRSRLRQLVSPGLGVVLAAAAALSAGRYCRRGPGTEQRIPPRLLHWLAGPRPPPGSCAGSTTAPERPVNDYVQLCPAAAAGAAPPPVGGL